MIVNSGERSGTVYEKLSNSFIYTLIQFILAPGSAKNFKKKISSIIEEFPNSQKYLDIGCGPFSLLNSLSIEKVNGADISYEYVKSFSESGNVGVVSSATHLSYKNISFDAIWSIGLLHHLSDAQFLNACAEMNRVCVKGGYVAIIDAVLPKSFFHSPIAWIIRKFDRGKFIRDQEYFLKLINYLGGWSIQRFTYAYNGLEGILAIKRN